MIIIIDGPEKAGKTTHINELNRGLNFSLADFEDPSDNTTEIVHNSGRDRHNGWGYLPKFGEAIMNPEVQLWDRGWFSELAYGELLDQDRFFRDHKNYIGWFYSRLMLGRGAEILLVPSDRRELGKRRTEDDVDVTPAKELNWFLSNNNLTNSVILPNSYDNHSLQRNVLDIKRTALMRGHGLNLAVSDYVGPINPTVTFVGTSSNSDSFMDDQLGVRAPFNDAYSAEYFKPFKETAIGRFGYTTVGGLKNLPSNLTKRLITVGQDAYFKVPESFNVPDIRQNLNASSRSIFKKEVIEGLRYFGVYK